MSDRLSCNWRDRTKYTGGNSAVVAFGLFVIFDDLLLFYHDDDILHNDLCLVRFKSKPVQSTVTLCSFSADSIYLSDSEILKLPEQHFIFSYQHWTVRPDSADISHKVLPSYMTFEDGGCDKSFSQLSHILSLIWLMLSTFKFQ